MLFGSPQGVLSHPMTLTLTCWPVLDLEAEAKIDELAIQACDDRYPLGERSCWGCSVSVTICKLGSSLGMLLNSASMIERNLQPDMKKLKHRDGWLRFDVVRAMSREELGGGIGIAS